MENKKYTGTWNNVTATPAGQRQIISNNYYTSHFIANSNYYNAYNAYEEAEKAKDKAWKAVKATSEYKRYVKALNALLCRRHDEEEFNV